LSRDYVYKNYEIRLFVVCECDEGSRGDDFLIAHIFAADFRPVGTDLGSATE